MVESIPRGRPLVHANQEQQKAKLLFAAQELLVEKSYRSITIRELAEGANVNSAMIRYYFGNKEGLFVALLDEMSEQFFTSLGQIHNTKNPLRSIIEVLIKRFSVNKGFARLVYDELKASESQLSQAFIERFPKRMATILPQLIMDNTAIRDKKRANYAAFSLMMLIITPFTAEPVRKIAWGISDDEIQSPVWADHIYSLFMLGCDKDKI